MLTFLLDCTYKSEYIFSMKPLEEIVLYALSVFGVAIIVKVNDKLVIVNPQILSSVSLDDIAESLSASELTEEEIIEGISVIDLARKPKK